MAPRAQVYDAVLPLPLRAARVVRVPWVVGEGGGGREEGGAGIGERFAIRAGVYAVGGRSGAVRIRVHGLHSHDRPAGVGL